MEVFNQINPGLQSSLTISITDPNGYGYFDEQPINVSAKSVTEYDFSWTVPKVAGTYVVSVGLAPPQLTAYDSVWLNVT